MGRLKKNGADSNVRTGLRIRHEIVNIIYRNPTVSVKIPTSVELARYFNVARCTVTEELKKLVDEGLLTGKRGIGTFTNPERLSFYSHMPGKHVIGILVGDSQMLCQDYTSWVLSSAVGMAMLPDVGHPRNITLTERSPDLMYKELRLLNLDGLIWVLPPPKMAPYLKKLRDDGMAVVTLHDILPGISGIEPDFIQQGIDIADILFKENKTRVLWSAFDGWAQETQVEAEKRFAEFGVVQDKALVWHKPNNFEKQFKDLLARNQLPDAIYVHSELVFMVIDILREHNIDPYKDCLLIASYGVIRKMTDFKGIVRHEPFEEMGQLAVKILADQLNQGICDKAPQMKRKFKLEYRK